MAIIAVFGSRDPETLALAEELGAEIAGQGHVVLTGGDGPGEGSVKARAIRGALRGDRPAPWIGVIRNRLEPPSFRRDGSGCVINTDLGHGRNYLEALLCDGAIALKGEGGTHSEVVFCLTSSKPVVLVGDPWKTDPESGFPPNADNRMQLTTALKYVKGANSIEYQGAEDQRIAELLELTKGDALGPLVSPSYVSAEAAGEHPADVVAQLLHRLPSNLDRPMGFPDLAGYEDVASAYSDYLASVNRNETEVRNMNATP